MLRLRQVLVPTVRRRLEVAGLHRAVPSAVMGLPLVTGEYLARCAHNWRVAGPPRA